jgi:DNA-directed RNA polymerase specialized sigma24 family protein
MNFNELIKSNKENVKNIIRLITKEENEDLEQEVYFKAWKNSDNIKNKALLKVGLVQLLKIFVKII